MSTINLRHVHKSYGSLEVINDINLDIDKGEFIVFVGPSGCGKSTLLRMIAGLEDINSGDLIIDGKRANDIAPADRGIAMVFQSYALYPHMTVYENLAFSLRVARVTKDELDKRVRAAAAMLQLDPYLLRRPRELSGGQRQRVAIGRAIVREAQVFLFDEPLSNLDAALRVATRIELARLKESLPDTTMVYVTHDQVEAMTLADRIVVLNGGRIEQIGRPVELYDRPCNLFVAGFIGSPAMNMLDVEGRQDDTIFRLSLAGRPDTALTIPIDGNPSAVPAKLGVRPEHLLISEADAAMFTGRVDIVEHLGEVTLAYLKMPNEQSFIAKLDGTIALDKGELVHLRANTANLHLFDAHGMRI